jgi:hypothetical protein
MNELFFIYEMNKAKFNMVYEDWDDDGNAYYYYDSESDSLTEELEPITPPKLRLENCQPEPPPEIPEGYIDVSEIIKNKVNSCKGYDKYTFLKSFDKLEVYYNPEINQFGIIKHNAFVKLKWNTQNVKNPSKTAKKQLYQYKYILIPYKKKRPIRLLESNWKKLYEQDDI